MVDFNPNYVPTGPNNRQNEYYKKINNVKLAKADYNRKEFFGTVGGGPQVSIQISASQTSGVGPLGVLFSAEIILPGGEPYYNGSVTWNTDTTGTFGLIPSSHRGGNDRSTAKGPLMSRVYQPGTYSVTATLEYDDNGPQTIVSDPIVITVSDPDVVYSAANTLVVSTAGDYTGAPAHDVGNRYTDFETALSAARTGDRVLFRTDETHSPAANTRITDTNWNDAYIGTFGSGAKPVVNLVGGGLGVINLDGPEFGCVWGINFQGGYDPVTGTGPEDHGLRMISDLNNRLSHYTVYDCIIDNADQAITCPDRNNNLVNIVGEQLSINGWHKYGIFVDLNSIGLSGCVIKQNPDAKSGTESNYPDANPIRALSVLPDAKLSLDRLDLFNNAGSSQNLGRAHQQCLRWPSTSAENHSGCVVNCEMEGGLSVIAHESQNNTTTSFPGQCLIEDNYIRSGRTTEAGNAGGTNSWIYTSFGGLVIRNNTFVQPDDDNGFASFESCLQARSDQSTLTSGDNQDRTIYIENNEFFHVQQADKNPVPFSTFKNMWPDANVIDANNVEYTDAYPSFVATSEIPGGGSGTIRTNPINSGSAGARDLYIVLSSGNFSSGNTPLAAVFDPTGDNVTGLLVGDESSNNTGNAQLWQFPAVMAGGIQDLQITYGVDSLKADFKAHVYEFITPSIAGEEQSEARFVSNDPGSATLANAIFSDDWTFLISSTQRARNMAAVLSRADGAAAASTETSTSPEEIFRLETIPGMTDVNLDTSGDTGFISILNVPFTYGVAVPVPPPDFNGALLFHMDPAVGISFPEAGRMRWDPAFSQDARYYLADNTNAPGVYDAFTLVENDPVANNLPTIRGTTKTTETSGRPFMGLQGVTAINDAQHAVQLAIIEEYNPTEARTFSLGDNIEVMANAYGPAYSDPTIPESIGSGSTIPSLYIDGVKTQCPAYVPVPEETLYVVNMVSTRTRPIDSIMGRDANERNYVARKGDILVYNRELTDEEAVEAENWIRAKYGMTLLPVPT